jgi:hypothetical protein
MEAEKSNVKALLKEELGLFKKDETEGEYKGETTDQEESVISVEWNDGEQPTKPQQDRKQADKSKEKTVTSDKPTEKKKKTPKWLEEKE